MMSWKLRSIGRSPVTYLVIWRNKLRVTDARTHQYFDFSLQITKFYLILYNFVNFSQKFTVHLNRRQNPRKFRSIVVISRVFAKRVRFCVSLARTGSQFTHRKCNLVEITHNFKSICTSMTSWTWRRLDLRWLVVRWTRMVAKHPSNCCLARSWKFPIASIRGNEDGMDPCNKNASQQWRIDIAMFRFEYES